jgi:hypothetical protein
MQPSENISQKCPVIPQKHALNTLLSVWYNYSKLMLDTGEIDKKA